MRIVLFDLGDTLEQRGRPRAGAAALLAALASARDSEGERPKLALVSDYGIAQSGAEAKRLRREYLDDLRRLNLATFFSPASKRVTLSSDVGVMKPDPRIFRAAIDRIHPGLPFTRAVFVTENAEHVRAARTIGMLALQVSAPGRHDGEVDDLPDALPVLRRLLAFSPATEVPEFAAARAAISHAKTANPAIQALVARVDRQRLEKSVQHLAAFGTRWSLSPVIKNVTAWVHAQFVARGYKTGKDVRYQPFRLGNGAKQRNVICGPKQPSRGLVVVCAHYDSTSESPAQSAPGADDDASGVAALLELARLLKGVPLARDVMFAAFGGEEQGLFGSTACADIAASEGWPIDLVINMDMIGYKPANAASRITVEYDHGNAIASNDAASKAFGLLMAQAARDYTTLEPVHTDIWSSDYMPFEAKGFACIGAYDGDDNPHYHHIADDAGTLDFAYMTEVVKMVLATIANVGDLA